MSKISAEIVAHSLNMQGDELVSVLVTFPRIILSEMNTHRMLSKNTSSSRAIPFKKMVDSVENDPFIPIAWQKQHSGMQGSEYYTDESSINSIIKDWLEARDNTIKIAKSMTRGGVTKQLCNRLLEPFMWTTMLITGPKSGWNNFFELRCPVYMHPLDLSKEVYKSKKDYIYTQKERGNESIDSYSEQDFRNMNKGQAEIHIMDLAEKIYDAFNESTPEVLSPGQWHIPFYNKIEDGYDYPVQGGEWSTHFFTDLEYVKISTAMAARTSYTVVGEEKDIDYEKMIGLHDRLLTQDPPHSSPMEHCAKAMNDEEYKAYTKTYYNEDTEERYYVGAIVEQGWCRNFKGFIPYRHIIETKTN